MVPRDERRSGVMTRVVAWQELCITMCTSAFLCFSCTFFKVQDE